MNRKADDKIAYQRLSVLELAKALGNVSEACRRRDISRQTFYEYKRRFEKFGLEGLKDLPPIPKSHPNTTPKEHVERLLALSLEHPAWGCNRLSDHLKLEGISISAPTIQNILGKHGYGTRYDRWLRLEEKSASEGIELSVEQLRFLEKQNPQWRERHVESSRPGELLSQDTFYVGHFKGVGKVYLHTVVDTYSSYAFGFLHTSKQPEAAVSVVHHDVVPFYKKHKLSIGAILTDNGTEFCGTAEHPYELYLTLCEIEHRRTKVGRPQTNGFVERFHRTVKEEFFETETRRTLYTSVKQLQTDLDKWLDYYNRERTHQGYRNLGRRPYETIKQYLETVKKVT
ncbi:MAG: IS481 family transposase [Rhodothermaceae bacterium]|nr:MAG: IS481 family transposase [Rhodothermaceae bacterium]GIV58865.1 MAG: IS481 family transposase [Rhodothermaceae bacterium]